jgi:peptidoglycan/LPS O-acetylase OafA/YrhL
LNLQRSNWKRLAEVEHGRNNNLNLIRFVLASAVIFSHSFVIVGGLAMEPMNRLLHFDDLGGVSVYSFFFISGYLILKSALFKNSIGAFLSARTLRIFPALLTVVVLCTFLLGPLVTTLSTHRYFANSHTWAYLLNALLHGPAQLTGVFTGSFRGTVNTPLWTLSSEWSMYIITLLVCLLFHWRHTIRETSVINWVLLGVAIIYTATLWPLPSGALPWALFFIAGGSAYLLRTYIRLIPEIAVPFFLIDLALTRFVPHLGKPLFPAALTYLILVLGFHPSLHVKWFHRIGDYSYGLYIYAWPIQQVTFSYTKRPILIFFISYLFTLPIAILSWHFVESPSLALKPKRRVADSTV